METLYTNLIGLFNEEDVEYVVLGGHAVIAHGHLRTTGDIDIFVSSSEENANRLVRALERFGYTNGEFVAEDFTKVPSYVSFSRYDHWIDLMTFTVGVTFEECYMNRDTILVNGISVNFISLPDLIKNKKATGRPNDLFDVEALQKPIS